MFEKLKNLFATKPVEEQKVEPKVEPKVDTPKKPRQPRKPKQVATKTAKEIATENDEPYITVTNVVLDKNDVNSGQMELDWNQKFVYNLVRAGYQHKKTDTEADIVDRWFQQVCTNISNEIHEQFEADPDNRTNTKVNK